MKKRLFSLLLVLCMVLTLFPSVAFAEEVGSVIDISSVLEDVSLCENHKTHDDCGYLEAVYKMPCGHLKEDGSYSCTPVLESSVSENTATPDNVGKEYVCDHNDGCGYAEAVEGVHCTHECELCIAVDVDKDIMVDACVCEILCSESIRNSACTVCATEGVDFATCKGESQRSRSAAPRSAVTGSGYNYDTDTKTLTIISDVGTTEWRNNAGISQTNVTTVVMTGVTAIGDNAFNNCANLTSVTIPDSVTVIGKMSFSNCGKLANVKLPSSLQSIGESAFYGCGMLSSITIPANVATVSNYAFYNSSNLASITFMGATPPATLGSSLFSTNSSFKIYVPSASLNNYKSRLGSAGMYVEALQDYVYNSSTKTLTINSNTGANSWRNNYPIASDVKNSATKIVIAEGVTSLGMSAFEGCMMLTSLADITFPSSLTSIGDYAFQNCRGLTSVYIPSSITSIGSDVFRNCTGLTKATISENVTSIGNNAFYDCSSLTNVTFTRTTPATIGGNVFSGTNSNLKIYVPASSVETYKAVSNLSVWENKIEATAIVNAETPVITNNLSTAEAFGGHNSNNVVALNAEATTTDGGTISYEWYSNDTQDTDTPTKLNVTTAAYTPKTNALGTVYYYCVITNTVEDNGDGGTKTATTTSNIAKITIKTVSAEATPNATFNVTGEDCGTLSGLTAGASYKYSTDGGRVWTYVTGTTITISSGITTTDGVQVVKRGNNTYLTDSQPQIIRITKAATPTGIGATDETPEGADGTITGVTTAMEYKLSTDRYYTNVIATTVVERSAGTYMVRVKASGTVLASDAVYVTVGYSKKTLTLSDLSYSLAAVNYDGSNKKINVTVTDSNYYGGIDVYYEGSTVQPVNAGTYAVTVNILGAGAYNAVTGLSLGNFVINKANYTGASSVQASIPTAGQTGATVTLPALPAGASYGTATASGDVIMTNISLSGTSLTYTVPPAATGQTGTITIPVTGATNYNNYNVVVTVNYAGKTSQQISYANANINKTYGDAKFVNPLTQTTVNGAVTYESNNTAVAVVNSTTGEVTVTGTGTATITATAAETSTHAKATASYTITVAKKQLTLTADNKSMVKGNAVPSLTYTPTGLVNGDTVTAPPAISATADGSLVGDFGITISGGTVTNSTNYNITYTNGTLTVLDPATVTYTITSVAGTGGSISPSGSVSINYGENKTFAILANSGYSILSVTVDGVNLGAISTYSFTDVKGNHTIAATFSQNSSGGNTNTGGNTTTGGNTNTGGGTVTPPAVEKPATQPEDKKPEAPSQGEIKLEGKTDTDGNMTISITDKNILDVIEKAEENAKKNGNTTNDVKIVFSATGGKNANVVTVNLPKIVQDTIISKKIVSTVVVVDNPDVQIDMDLKAINEINKQANADVNITATRMDNGKLTGMAKTAIGSRPVFDLAINYGKDKKVTNFKSGNISVSIPYKIANTEAYGNICAVYVDDNGKVEYLANSVYDVNAKTLRFSSNHFSVFGVGYKQDTPSFTDIENHWAKSDIEFAVSRELLTGKGVNKFGPDDATTRGMIAIALGKLENVEVSKYKKDIISGKIGKFISEQSITREEIAVMIQNYAKDIGFTLPKVYEEQVYSDSAKISNNAKQAVKTLQMAGIIMGKSSNMFDPKGTVTKAEVSAILRRFVELRISSDMAKGWTMNDSGKWMYYENGKYVTGKQDIGGVGYNFNQNGETADCPRR